MTKNEAHCEAKSRAVTTKYGQGCCTPAQRRTGPMARWSSSNGLKSARCVRPTGSNGYLTSSRDMTLTRCAPLLFLRLRAHGRCSPHHSHGRIQVGTREGADGTRTSYPTATWTSTCRPPSVEHSCGWLLALAWCPVCQRAIESGRRVLVPVWVRPL